MNSISEFLNSVSGQIKASTGLSILCWTVLLDGIFAALILFGLSGKWSRRSSLCLLGLNAFIFVNLINQGY